MSDLFTVREVSHLVGISEHQVRYWDRTGLIAHATEAESATLFDFPALVAFRAVKKLLESGASLRRIRRALTELQSVLPAIEDPLAETQVSLEGGEIVFHHESVRFTPHGQLLIDFSRISKAPQTLPIDRSEELFFRALEREERDPEGARRDYERLLALRPGHRDAEVNLGNLLYAEGNSEEAERCYRRALGEDPEHVEANYNLANLLEERGEPARAVHFYRVALGGDPDFADAHFNLARVLEVVGRRVEARDHWRAYLDREPAGEHARYARECLRRS